jgi:hypothetical protein
MSCGTQPKSPFATAAFDAGWLDLGHWHRVYYEHAGTPEGIPMVPP